MWRESGHGDASPILDRTRSDTMALTYMYGRGEREEGNERNRTDPGRPLGLLTSEEQ